MRGRVIALAMAAAIAHPCSARSAVTDDVLGRLVGTWRISGTTLGKPTVTTAEVDPEFGGAFLDLHVKDPTGANPYEARIFFGQASDGTLVVHWLDATGGESSRTLGSGRAQGDGLAFSFAYPDGVFRDRLTYDRRHDRWRLFIQTGPAAHSQVFSDWYFDRAKPGGKI